VPAQLGRHVAEEQQDGSSREVLDSSLSAVTSTGGLSSRGQTLDGTAAQGAGERRTEERDHISSHSNV
jgi:hypothetical protein